MRTLNLKDNFVRGWIVGDFSPSIYTSSDIEVGILHHEKGVHGDGHYHKINTEYNFIVRGKVKFNGQVLETDDVFIFEPNDRAEFEVLEDTDLLVLKLPATKKDKYYD